MVYGKLTREEFQEKYGSVLVTFTSYFKYCFTFRGSLPDGRTIVVTMGGSPDDIYRERVIANKPVPIVSLTPYESGVVFGKDGETVEEEIDPFYVKGGA